MKVLKNILVLVLLSLVVLFYYADDFVDSYGQILNKIEITQTNATTQSSNSPEPSAEDETFFIRPENNFLITHFSRSKVVEYSCSYSSQLVYPIWLPPDIS